MLPGPSVGASGAIFGLSGAIVAFLLRRRHTFYVRDNRVGVVLLLWAAAQLGLGLLSPQVDNYCHAGGLVAGAVLGLVLPGRKRAA
jgi:rhomboid protease GluP